MSEFDNLRNEAEQFGLKEGEQELQDKFGGGGGQQGQQGQGQGYGQDQGQGQGYGQDQGQGQYGGGRLPRRGAPRDQPARAPLPGSPGLATGRVKILEGELSPRCRTVSTGHGEPSYRQCVGTSRNGNQCGLPGSEAW